MKKLFSLALAVILTLSLSACAMGNNDNNNNNGVGRMNTTDNGGLGVRRITQPNNYNNNNVNYNTTATGAYRDGIYTAQGDAHVNGNEQATVVIRNGRIAEVALTTIGAQNRTNFEIGNGVTINNQGRTNNLVGDGLGMNNNAGMNNPSGVGVGSRIVPGTTSPIGEDEMNEVRTKLIGKMIEQQRGDVTITYGNPYSVNMVNNWRVAASRALDQARR